MPETPLAARRSALPALFRRAIGQAAALCVLAIALFAAQAAEPGVPPAPDAARGEQLYYEYCAACHNSTGKVGPRLIEHAAYFIQAGIPAEAMGMVLSPALRRRPPGSNMPVFTPEEVSDADLADIGYFLAQRYPAPAIPPPTGDATRGAGIYASQCRLCHGDGGCGTEQVRPLAALAGGLKAGGAPPAVMHALVLLACRSGDVPRMPKYEASSLDDQACADLAAYLWGFEAPVGEQ